MHPEPTDLAVRCLGFIGTGAMATAIAQGIRRLDSGIRLQYFNPNTASAQKLADMTDGTVVSDVSQILSSDMVILAVKPQVLPLVLAQIRAATNPENAGRPALVSIAAGQTLSSISSELNNNDAGFPLARVMPNVCAKVGLSASAVSFPEGTEEATKEQVIQVFSAIGTTVELPETQIPAFTAMAGSSPAWIAQIVRALADGGVKHGLTRQLATQAALQALLGTATMLQQMTASGSAPSDLIDQVCSPGGTTIAGLLAGQERGLSTALVAAVDACIERDRELT